MPIVEKNKVQVEKLLHIPAPRVFEAIAQGKLLYNCGGDVMSMKNDFRVGGGYSIKFAGNGETNAGKYLEIDANKKVVFTWGDQGAGPVFPRSTVTVQLKAEGDNTRLLLEHSGFEKLQDAENHNGGWMSIVPDFVDELESNRLRMSRSFQIPVEKLFAACSRLEVFYKPVADVSKGSSDFKVGGRFTAPTEKGTVTGQYLAIEPNKKIQFTWDDGCGQTGAAKKSSTVTLTFKEKNGGSVVALVHEGLPSAEAVEQTRYGWARITNALMENQQTL